jgi:hypothetical protein
MEGYLIREGMKGVRCNWEGKNRFEGFVSIGKE